MLQKINTHIHTNCIHTHTKHKLAPEVSWPRDRPLHSLENLGVSVPQLDSDVTLQLVLESDGLRKQQAHSTARRNSIESDAREGVRARAGGGGDKR